MVEFVERMVARDEPTRGFGYLEDAGRLDLTVEAVVADETQPFHVLFSPEAVAASRARLAHAHARLGEASNGRIRGRADNHVECVDHGVGFEVELLRTVMSVGGEATRLDPGRYTVSLMRHWAARLDEEGGLRAGDIWFLVDRSQERAVWVRAAECRTLK